MTTLTDFLRGNFNGDTPVSAGGAVGSVGDLFLFDNFGNKAIWLEDGAGGRLAASPGGFNLPFTGPTWHIAAIADFDSSTKQAFPLGNNPSAASDLLWVNDNGDLALWQSNGSNVNSFPGNENQVNLGNPGAGWHVASTNDFDGNQAADILFQHDSGALAIWEFRSFNPSIGFVLQGAPVIKPGGQLNVDQNVGPTWHVVATGDINDDQNGGIVFQNNNGAIAAWENPTQVGTQIHFNIQSDLPNPGPGWHVVGMGQTTEDAFTPGSDLVLQHDNGNIAIWQLQVVFGNHVERQGPGGTDFTGFNLGNPGAGWHVVGVRDMDGDSRADILLQNDNGAAAVWDNIQQIPNTSNGTHAGFNFNPQPDPNPNPGIDWHIV